MRGQIRTWRRRRLKWIIPAAVLVILACVFFIYTGIYYHADATALEALTSDAKISVVPVDGDLLFDGPSDRNALIFYPGAKVEETAYAPLMHSIAEQGMDVFLVKMPFRLAIFGMDKATSLKNEYEYENWYIVVPQIR